jgi:hypothetical protein
MSADFSTGQIAAIRGWSRDASVFATRSEEPAYFLAAGTFSAFRRLTIS